MSVCLSRRFLKQFSQNHPLFIGPNTSRSITQSLQAWLAADACFADFSSNSHLNLSQRLRPEVFAPMRTTRRQTSRAQQHAASELLQEDKTENCAC